MIKKKRRKKKYYYIFLLLYVLTTYNNIIHYITTFGITLQFTINVLFARYQRYVLITERLLRT